MSQLLLGCEYQWIGDSNYLWVLDAGHGGLNDEGHYMTAPAKMHRFKTFTIYEGVINRIITKLVQKQLDDLRIDYAIVSDPIIDTPLSIRVSRADAVYAKDRRAVYISIHSNAGGGSGFEIFTSPGQTKSDKIADIFIQTYRLNFPSSKFRTDKADGDDDKESAFFVLRKTDCPAILIENLFFDNPDEAIQLMHPDVQRDIANCIVEAIQKVEKLKPI